MSHTTDENNEFKAHKKEIQDFCTMQKMCTGIIKLINSREEQEQISSLIIDIDTANYSKAQSH